MSELTYEEAVAEAEALIETGALTERQVEALEILMCLADQ